jgi:OOP family OmpA-OmpF porin
MLEEAGIPHDSVLSRWEPYQSSAAPIALQRARALLETPETVSLSLEGGVLAATGTAPHEWIERAAILARLLPGVAGFSSEQLEDADMARLQQLQSRIESHVFYLLVGKPDLKPGQEKALKRMLDEAREFSRLARHLHHDFQIEIRGHTSASADDDTNESASLTLARRFHESLRWQEIDPSIFTVRGLGSEPPAALPAGQTPQEAYVSLKVTHAN